MKADFRLLFLLFMASVRSRNPGPTLVPGVLLIKFLNFLKKSGAGEYSHSVYAVLRLKTRNIKAMCGFTTCGLSAGGCGGTIYGK